MGKIRISLYGIVRGFIATWGILMIIKVFLPGIITTDNFSIFIASVIIFLISLTLQIVTTLLSMKNESIDDNNANPGDVILMYLGLALILAAIIFMIPFVILVVPGFYLDINIIAYDVILKILLTILFMTASEFGVKEIKSKKVAQP